MRSTSKARLLLGCALLALALLPSTASTQFDPDKPLRFWPMGVVPGHDGDVIGFYNHGMPVTDELDHRCENSTRVQSGGNGHLGTDVGIRSFAEQRVGVPVFAPLAGTVTTVLEGNCDECESSTLCAVGLLTLRSECSPVAICCSGSTDNRVFIDHGNGLTTNYLHLKKDVPVTMGQQVHAGEVIGYVGSAGITNYPHLHLSTICNNIPRDPFGEPDLTTGCVRAGSADHWFQYGRPALGDPSILRVWDLGIANGVCEAIALETVTPKSPRPMPVSGWVQRNEPTVWVWGRVFGDQDERVDLGFVLQDHSGTPVLTDAGVIPADEYARAREYRWRHFKHALDLRSIPLEVGDYNLHIDLTAAGIGATTSVDAPLRVVAGFERPPNRKPNDALDLRVFPDNPTTADPMWCQLVMPEIRDPDYDVVAFRYVWTVGTTVIRDATHAGQADVITCDALRLAGVSNQAVTVSVTPVDVPLNACGEPIGTVPGKSAATIARTSNVVTGAAGSGCSTVELSTVCFDQGDNPGRWSRAENGEGHAQLAVRGELAPGGEVWLQITGGAAGQPAVWLFGESARSVRSLGAGAQVAVLGTRLDSLGTATVTFDVPESLDPGSRVFVRGWVLDVGADGAVTRTDTLAAVVR